MPDSGTVLFVDDDRAMVNSTTQWLKLSGLDVKSFADPTALLRTLKPQMNAIIISDIRMPEMDGIQMMKQAFKTDKHIPVILITGHGDVQLAVEAMKKGAFDFITKPFSPEFFLQRAQDALKLRHSQLTEMQTQAQTKPIEPEETDEDAGTLSGKVEEYEKALIENSLKKHNGKIGNVMKDLDLPRRTLNAKMKKYGINRKSDV